MIRLERFTADDFDTLIGWIGSEEDMIRFSGPAFTFPVTHEQLYGYISGKNRIVFKVVDETTGQTIGHAELNAIDQNNRNARICRILVGKTDQRNKGYGEAIIRALVRYGFETLGLHRLDLGVYDFNTQAIKCYQKCGFEIEGLMRENAKVGNVYWSTYNMSLLNPEDSL